MIIFCEETREVNECARRLIFILLGHSVQMSEFARAVDTPSFIQLHEGLIGEQLGAKLFGEEDERYQGWYSAGILMFNLEHVKCF